MKQEYDFSRGERGKFCRPSAKLRLPVYLDDDVLAYLQQRAKSKDVDVNQLVNDMLKHEIDLIQTEG